jgi:hypothetical protein
MCKVISDRCPSITFGYIVALRALLSMTTMRARRSVACYSSVYVIAEVLLSVEVQHIS